MLDTSPIPQPLAPTAFSARSYARHNHEDNIKCSQNICAKKHYQPLFSKYEVMAWKALLEMKSDIQEFDRELLLEELQKLQKSADEASETEHVTADVVKLNMQDKKLEATIASIAGTCGLFVSTSTDLTKSIKNNKISKNEFKFENETHQTGETKALEAYAEETTESPARNSGFEMTEDINNEEWREENQETASGKVYHQTAEIAETMSNAAKRKLRQELLNLELNINTDINIQKQRKEDMETIMVYLQNDHVEERAIMLDEDNNEIRKNMTKLINDPVENRTIMFDADKSEIRQKIDALEADIEDDIVMQEWRKADLEATLAELQEEIRLEEMRNKELENNIHRIRGRLINTQDDIVMQECRKGNLEATLADLQEHIRLVEMKNKELEDNVHGIRGRLIKTHVQTEPYDAEDNPCARQLTMPGFSCLHGNKCWKH